METVLSSEQLERFTYHPLSDGSAVVYLRENIEQDAMDNGEDGEAVEFWRADEVCVVTTLALSEIEDNFDELWVKGVAESKSIEERLGELEELTDALVGMALEEE